MITSTRNRSLSLLIAVLLCSWQFCFAEAPSGPVSLAFNSASATVWDLSGQFQIDQQIAGAGGQDLPLSFFGLWLTNDVNGQLHGSGTIAVAIGNDFVAADYVALGNIRGAGDTRRMLLTVRLSGQDTIAGALRRFRINVQYNLVVVPASGTLEGKARGNAVIAGAGSGKIKSDHLTVALPGVQDGSWTVQINLLPLSRLSGTATIVLSNGRTFPATLTGTYSARADVSRVTLTGINEGRGITLGIVFSLDEGVATVEKLQGAILGQRVRD